jgi:hypothetical protein
LPAEKLEVTLETIRWGEGERELLLKAGKE